MTGSGSDRGRERGAHPPRRDTQSIPRSGAQLTRTDDARQCWWDGSRPKRRAKYAAPCVPKTRSLIAELVCTVLHPGRCCTQDGNLVVATAKSKVIQTGQHVRMADAMDAVGLGMQLVQVTHRVRRGAMQRHDAM